MTGGLNRIIVANKGFMVGPDSFRTQMKINADGKICSKQGGENGVQNRGVFARSWYFGSM